MTVTGADVEAVDAGRQVTIKQGDALTVMGSDKIDAIHGNYDVTADKSFQVTQAANSLLIKDAVTIQSVGDIDLKNDGCEILAAEGGKLQVTALQEIQLKCGPASITLKMDGSIVLDGITGIQATSGPSQFKLAPDGATLQGPQVGLTGMALVQIAAPIIKVG